MIIPLGMIRATRRDGYGRPVDVLINPLQVMGIIGHHDRSVVFFNDGRSFEVCESADTLEKAWTEVMKHVVEEPELEDPS